MAETLAETPENAKKKYIRRELVGAFNDDHSAGVVDDEIIK